jgi:uncharacterized membrane protein
VVVGLFLVSGTIHLLRPSVFTPIVPDLLPAHRLLVYVSGIAELACAAGLVWRRTRWLAGFASAVLLVAVFPANVTMAVDAWRSWQGEGHSGLYVTGTLLRLPLQVPLVWWAWRLTLPARADRVRGDARRPRPRARPPAPGRRQRG